MITDEVIERIQKLYNSCAKSERPYLRKMLEEFAETGHSITYESVWLEDYKEIPVDIDTFLCSDLYLGKTNRQGEAVFPHWRKVYRDIFNAGNKYQEVVLSGATRIGKTSTAVGGSCYMLYRLMCLRDPQKFFQKKDVSKFSILFFNITKDMAKGVAFREFNDTLKSSPWFNAHGTFSKSERDFYYIPEGGKIDIDYGSDAAHGLGKQVFCVVGDTRILTSEGFRTIEDLYRSGGSANVGQFSGDSVEYSEAEVVLTDHVTDTIRLTLEDGSTVEGTADHPVLLSDGSYKRLGDICEDDDILTLNMSRGG